MAKRKRLADLVREEAETQHESTPPTADSGISPDVTPNLKSTAVSDSRTPEVRKSVSRKRRPRAQKTAVTDPEPVTPPPQTPDASSLPKYLQLARKDARLREDQLESLTSLARHLNKQRRGRGERITENTLIRVAVDLLLARQGDLQGVDEEELVKALQIVPSKK